MPFLQLRIATQDPETAAELCEAYGAPAVSFIDAHDDPVLEPRPGETPLWPETVTLALFPQDTDTARLFGILKDTLPEGQGLDIQTESVEDRDWIRLWLEHWPPKAFGEKATLWVTPAARAAEVPAGAAHTLVLDPGLAFGTGAHQTTALCLDWLADHADRVAGAAVLDYGCGSGILAVAALKLGATAADGVDIDPQALAATHANAAANGVDAGVATFLPEDFAAARGGRTYPLVLANILARPLVELAPEIAARTAPGGWLVLAGLLDSHADEVMAAYAPWFDFAPHAERDHWRRLAARKRA